MHKALNIYVSDDELEAILVIDKDVLEYHKGLLYPTLPDVLEACREQDIIYGIDEEKVRKFLNFRDTEIPLASGKPMVPTVPDKVTYTFEDMRKKLYTPTILANEKADFYNLVTFKKVKQNELLVYIKKGYQGTLGITVSGEEITPDKYVPMHPEVLKRFSAHHTKITPDGVVSQIDGIPIIYPDGKVGVDESYIVNTDVDFATGSVFYDGPILVKGSVNNHFTVKSTKDIVIEGIVDGGIIEADGMVVLSGGINKGKVKAKMNVAAKYIYASEIETEGSVIASEAILNSKIKARTVIVKGEQLKEKSGQIAGGNVSASNFVWAKTLGSATANHTEIKITTFADKKLYEELKQERENNSYEYTKLYRIMVGLDEVKKRNPNQTMEFKNQEKKVNDLMHALKQRAHELESQIADIERQILIEEKDSKKKVFVTSTLYSKVHVQMDQLRLTTMLEYGPSIIHIDRKKYKLKIDSAPRNMILPDELK